MESKILVLMYSFILFAATGPISLAQDQTSHVTLTFITPTEVNKLLKDNKAILVDVREADEITLGLAGSAQWMPLSKMKNEETQFMNFLNALPKDKLIVLYCAGGKRAAKAQVELENRGYQTANMGGFSEWLKAQLPIKKLEKK